MFMGLSLCTMFNQPHVLRQSRLAWFLLVWLLLVAVPLATAGLAALWIELCKGMYIPGAFLAIPGYLTQGLLVLYAAPVHGLTDSLCFTSSERAIVKGLPCDAATWSAVALFYTLIALALTTLLRGLWAQRRRQ
jgi:hypothetical protein